MDQDGLPIVGTGIDYTKVRLLTYSILTALVKLDVTLELKIDRKPFL